MAFFKKLFGGSKKESPPAVAGDVPVDVPPEFSQDVWLIARLAERRRRDPGALGQEVRVLENILRRLPEGNHPAFRAEVLYTLGNARQELLTGDRDENVRQAIVCYRQALHFQTPAAAPGKSASIQNNLGDAYRALLSGSRDENLRQAIACYGEALRFRTPAGVPLEYAATRHSLGQAYQALPTGDHSENLQQAIACYREALRFWTPEATPFEYAAAQHDLGQAYRALPGGDRSENLKQAIACCRAALRFRTPEVVPFDYALTQNNLGEAYRNLPAGDRSENLKRAVACYREALRFWTPDTLPGNYALVQNNLGQAYQALPDGDRSENLQQAVACYREALRFWTPDAAPRENRKTYCQLADLYFGERRWAEALEAWQAALAADEMLLAAAYREAGCQAEVSETGGLYARAAYCLLQTGQPGAALGLLERGQVRRLAWALALAEVDRPELPEAQRQSLQTLRQAIHVLEGEVRLPPGTPARRDDRQLAERLRVKRAELNALIAAIGQDRPDFRPAGLELPELLALIPQETVWVAPLVTAQGSAVFVVPPGVTEITAAQVIRLDDFKDADLEALWRGSADRPGWLRAYAAYRLTQDLRTGQTALEACAGQMWAALLAPVHERLAALGASRVVCMPSGGLQLLPLHAAWRIVAGRKRAFLDDYEVTYVPSAYAFKAARRRAGGRIGRTAFVAGLNAYTRLSCLVNAVPEAQVVAQVLGTRPWLDAAVTPAAVTANARSAAFLHLACHGSFAWGENPLNSAVYLADAEPFTLAEIIAGLDLSAARLVTLSACETGFPAGHPAPDEYLGLAAGCLQAGAPAVVSSLWTVDDRSTALLMERFYRNHLEKGLAFPAALREAQCWLRDATRQELREYSQVRLRLSQAGAAAGAPDGFKDGAPDDRPYANPFYWAAFTFTGAGG